MSLPYGVTVSTVLGKVREETQDTGASPRWSDGLLLQYVNEVFRDLGSARCFRRTDVLVPTAGKAVYRYLCEPVDVYGVWYNGSELVPKSQAELYRVYGQNWQVRSASVEWFVADDTLRVVGVPAYSGAAPSSVSTAPLTESEGLGPAGSGYWSFDNSGTIVHFLPGAGTVTGWDGANLLWVDYAYMPQDVLATEKILRVYEYPVTQWCIWRCLSRSDDKAEIQQAEVALKEYGGKRSSLLRGGSPKFKAGWTPSFVPDASGWESQWSQGKGSPNSVFNG